MNELKDFKKELKELLKKYDATIMFDCADCSDLHGVYDERLVFFIGTDERKTNQHLLHYGYCVDANDL